MQFEHYGQSEGLSQGTINDMVSYDGFMWFATQDGLNRFDGLTFDVFRKAGPHSLNNNLIQTLLADSRGRLWVGTGSGINIYDRRDGTFQSFFEAFRLHHLIERAAIHKLFEDKRGRIWIITTSLGLFCFDPARRTVRPFFANDNTLVSGCVKPSGEVWVVMLNELFRYDERSGTFRSAQIRQKLHTNSLIRTVFSDKQAHLWVTTSEAGAFRIGPTGMATQFSTRTTPYLTGNDVTTGMCDRAGRVWLGTRTGGLCIYHPGTQQFQYVRHSRYSRRSLAEDFVWQLYQDHQGIVWVGSSSQGIDKYDPQRFPFGLIQQNDEAPEATLPDNMIFRIFGQGDNLYIGTETGGAAQYSTTTGRMTSLARLVPKSVSAMNNETRVITADSDGQLWFANWREVAQYDPVRRRARVYPATGIRTQLYTYGALALTDSTGHSAELWIAGQGGLTRFGLRTRQWKTWHDLPALQAVSAYNTRLIYQPVRTMVWLGTLGNGLIGYDLTRRTTVSFTDKNGLSCANVRGLLQTGSILWVGTDCGLYQLDLRAGRVVRHYTQANGLPNEVIYGILSDNQGDLWLSSNQGLTRFSPRLGRVVKNYDVTDGLQSNEFNTNVCYKHTDGTLFFGGVNGITYFRPDQFRPNRFVPPVKITAVSVFDSAYNPNRQQLTLGPRQNFVQFAFTALNFSNSTKNQFQYQLAGIDPGWVQAGHRRTANYTNLPPGDYVFRVKGSNDDGIWNNRGASMVLVIEPPFWGTWWFRLLLLLLLMGGMYGLYRYRIYALQQRQANELTVTVRTQELERQRFAKELHDGIGANLSVLKLYLSALGSPGMSVEAIRDRSLMVLSSSVSDVRSLVHDMHPRHLHEQGLAQTIADMVQLLNESRQLRVTYQAQNLPDTLPEAVEINLFRVVQELLQNTLKHAQATEAMLTLRTTPDQLYVDYHDNGRGFDATRPNGASGGNGLLNIRQRVELLKGNCHITSSPGAGTSATVSVPLAT
ncbi:hypothetical protein AWR27_03790 [Spirosoma montaniterrae]|uniref:Histidine kinase domain-containing protein n=2 Tax=Spirosoma montaniterrae TaxID=1178516 RepID=A0A1P9WT47_9BACT|nr:hypothetical protein AWR27_03790 [Spirosoma montaniterrae]